MALNIFITSVIVLFVLKFIGGLISSPIRMLNNHYRENTENSRVFIGLLIFIDMLVIAISGIWSAWVYIQ